MVDELGRITTYNSGVIPNADFFYRKKGRAREALTKEKKRLFLDQEDFSLGENIGMGFHHADCVFSI